MFAFNFFISQQNSYMSLCKAVVAAFSQNSSPANLNKKTIKNKVFVVFFNKKIRLSCLLDSLLSEIFCSKI